MKKVRILGVEIDDLSLPQAMERLRWSAAHGRRRLVVTPNPEILLAAREDPSYAALLNRADLKLPDGFGLRLVSAVRQRCSGADLAAELLALASQEGWRVLCVVRPDGLSTPAQVAAAVTKLAPGARVQVLPVTLDAASNLRVLDQVTEFNPQLALVGLGFPDQERWLLTRASHLPGLKIGLALGGTFDYWSGAVKRAPKAFRMIGMEWFWRFLRQPSRIRRIFRAVVIFPIITGFSQRRDA